MKTACTIKCLKTTLTVIIIPESPASRTHEKIRGWYQNFKTLHHCCVHTRARWWRKGKHGGDKRVFNNLDKQASRPRQSRDKDNVHSHSNEGWTSPGKPTAWAISQPARKQSRTDQEHGRTDPDMPRQGLA